MIMEKTWLKNITALQEVLAYIEENLEEDIDISVLARLAAMSGHSLQVLFSSLCGISLKEYIRRRRLSRAAIDVRRGADRILDIAIRYGYDSADGFSRAFKGYHGSSPSEVRKHDAALNMCVPIDLSVYVNGGNDLSYRLLELEKSLYVGFSSKFHGGPGDERQDEQEQSLHLDVETTSRIDELMRVSDETELRYSLIRPISEESYLYSVAVRVKEGRTLPEGRFHQIETEGGSYIRCLTQKGRHPVLYHRALREQMASVLIPELGLSPDPHRTEIYILHCFEKEKLSRYIEVLLPVLPG